jgi:hypothetical protein
MTTVTDYASLQTAITDFTTRSDLTTYTDYFIQRAEEDIYNDIFTLNEGRGIAALETSFTGVLSGNTLALPANYLGLRYSWVSIGGRNYPLARKTMEYINAKYPDQSSVGPPAFIARSGTSFIFAPYPDSGYTVGGIYWQRMAALSSTNTTTWMTSDIPSTLLAACLRVMGRFTKDTEMISLADADYQSGLASFVSRSKAEDYSGSELTMEVD